MWRRRPRLLLENKLLLRVLPTSGGARGELLGYAGGQCCPAASVFRSHLDGEEFQNQDLDNCKILCRFKY